MSVRKFYSIYTCIELNSIHIKANVSARKDCARLNGWTDFYEGSK